MPVTDAPDELEVKDFYFKQVIKFRVHAGQGSTENQRLNVLSVSNKYGLTFVGIPSGFVVYRTADITKRASEIEKAASTIVEDLEKWAEVPCKTTPSFVSLSADDLTLAVCVKEGCFVFAHMYDVRAFVTKDAKPSPFLSVKLSSKESDLQDLAWNPSADFSSMFVSCMSDGDLALWEVKGMNLHAVAAVADAGATCICWSPKGKQVAVGKQDGTIVQFDHQLKVKKVVPGPTGLSGDPVKVLDLLWQSTHVFMAAYVPQDESNTEPPCLILINIPKGEEPKYINYDDVCYGGADDRKHKYYFISLAEWNMVVASSAAAAESAIVGRNAQSSLWERWSLDDSGRAEMPLTDDHMETYPVGIAIDFTQQEEILISDTIKHPPSPLFMALSTDGVLMVYYMINKQPNAKPLNTASQPLTSQGERKSAVSAQPAAPAPKPVPASEPPKFGGIFGGGANVPKPAGGSTASTAAPSSGFTFGGQPTISFAKPAAQISGANAQKPAFSFKPGETTTTKPAGASGPFLGGVSLVNNPSETSFSFKPAAPSQSEPSAGFSFTKPMSDTSQATQPALTPKPSAVPSETQSAPQVTSAGGFSTPGFSIKPQQISQSAVSVPPPAVPSLTPAKATSSPAAVLETPRPTGTKQSRPLETPTVVSKSQGQQPPGAQQNKPQASVAPVRSPTKRSVDGAVENPFVKSIMDEIRDFNQELLEMKQRSLSLRVDIGSKEEQTSLRERTKNVSDFCGEIKVTMKSLNEDIHSLKSDCLEGFALIEECTARQQKSNDPRYQQLLASRALDPLSARRMKEIRTQLQYVDSSVRDVNGRMDEQWEGHMNKQNQSRKMYVPLSDTIYQTIKNNHAIYSNQCKLLEQLTTQLQDLKITNKSSWQPTSTGTPSRGRFGNLSSSPMFSPAAKIGSPHQIGTPKASPISPEKSAKLREYLGKRRVTPIKATAPANLSMSKIAAAESLRHSLLEDSLTPPFSPEVSARERIISNDFRADLASSTPLRPITTGARQIVTEPPAISASTPVVPPQRVAEGFQRIPEGSSSSSSQGAPRIGMKPPGPMVKDAPNGAAMKPSLPSFSSTTVNMPKPVFSFGTSGVSGTPSVPGGVIGGTKPAMPKPPAEGSASGKPPSSSALTMTLGPSAVAPPPASMATTVGTNPTAGPPSFSFGITTGIAKPAAVGFTFGAPGGVSAKPADIKPAAPSGTYKPTVEDITPPGTPPVEREDPEGFQQDDEHRPAITKPAKPDASNTMLKNLLSGAGGGASTAATKATTVSTTTTSLTSHPSRSLFTVGAESGSGADFSSKPASASRVIAFAKSPVQSAAARDTNRVTKNLFGSVGGDGSTGGAAASGTDSGPVSFSIAGKGGDESGSESTSPSPQQLEDDDAAEGQEAAAGGTETTAKPSQDSVATTTSAPSGFSFSLSTPSTGATSASGFSFKPPGGQTATSSIFGGTTSSSVFGGSSQTSAFGSSIFGKLGSSTMASATSTTTPSTLSTTASVMTTTASSTSDVTATTATDSKPVVTTTASTAAVSSPASGFVFSTTSTTPATSTMPTTAPATTSSSGLSSFSFVPTGSLFGKPAGSPASVFGGSSTTASTATTTAAVSTTTTSVTSVASDAKPVSTSAFGTTAFSSGASTTATEAPGFSFVTPATSVFGGGTTTSAFGATTAVPASVPASTTSSIFGSVATTSSGASSVFGGAATTATSTAFGSSTASGGATTSLFGGTIASTGTTSVFGGTPATSTTPAFGTATTTSTAPAFGGTPSTTTGTTSIFGGSPATTAATSSSGSIFGGGQGSGFGTTTATSSAAPFGSAGSAVFGGTTTSAFGSAATTTQSAFGSSSAFGQPTSGAGGFGTTSTFGQSGGVFGGQSSTGSVFGGTPTTPSSGGIFGQTSSANTPTSGGAFGGGGGLFSGLGGKPSAENANKNVFGGNVTFGGTGGNNALFGQQGSQSFGQQGSQSFGQGQSSGSAFGGGAFGSQSSQGSSSFSSANQGSIATAGFGGFQTPPKQTGQFGGSPAFGGGSAFGASPTFGGGAVFGASPTYGGVSQPTSGGGGVFGGGASSNQQSAGFASFASAQAPSFGALAGTGSPAGFGGGASTGFGDMAQQGSVFGGGAQNQGFGSSPAFGGGGGGGGSPAFSAYRG